MRPSVDITSEKVFFANRLLATSGRPKSICLLVVFGFSSAMTLCENCLPFPGFAHAESIENSAVTKTWVLSHCQGARKCMRRHDLETKRGTARSAMFEVGLRICEANLRICGAPLKKCDSSLSWCEIGLNNYQ